MKPLILYAEDDRDLAELFCDSMEKAGYDVNLAKNKREALEMYQKEAPDVIVLDISRPLKDGFEVLKKIRESDSRTPILMISTDWDDESETMGIILGVDKYLRHKVPRNLLAIIEYLMRFYPVNRDKN